MKRLDQVTGAVLFLISVYFVSVALTMPQMTGKSPGSGWLPLWIGVLVAFLSALLFITAGLRNVSQDKTVTWATGKGLANNVAILGGLGLSVVLLETVGYLIATFAFLLGLLWFLGKYSWKFNLGMSLVSSLVMYWVFKVWLGIPLPAGMINFL